MKNICEKQIVEITAQLKDGSCTHQKQDNKIANYWRKRTRLDGIIDWRMSGKMIDNLVRALSEQYPGASFKYKNIEHKVWKSKVIQMKSTNIEPGKVVGEDEEGYIIKCAGRSMDIPDQT